MISFVGAGPGWALLVDSLPMALCVVAFGDADWRL